MLTNLTPHAIVFTTGLTVPPSGQVARCAQVSQPAGEADGVPLFHTAYGAVEGLPEPVSGTLYIVSAMVRAAVPHRQDVASPGDLVRDGEGKVTGCKGLVVNPPV
jgi:hypothetical protein